MNLEFAIEKSPELYLFILCFRFSYRSSHYLLKNYFFFLNIIMVGKMFFVWVSEGRKLEITKVGEDRIYISEQLLGVFLGVALGVFHQKTRLVGSTIFPQSELSIVTSLCKPELMLKVAFNLMKLRIKDTDHLYFGVEMRASVICHGYPTMVQIQCHQICHYDRIINVLIFIRVSYIFSYILYIIFLKNLIVINYIETEILICQKKESSLSQKNLCI